MSFPVDEDMALTVDSVSRQNIINGERAVRQRPGESGGFGVGERARVVECDVYVRRQPKRACTADLDSANEGLKKCRGCRIIYDLLCSFVQLQGGFQDASVSSNGPTLADSLSRTHTCQCFSEMSILSKDSVPNPISPCCTIARESSRGDNLYFPGVS